ncbi:FecR family protein [Hirschia litorea]|uniref:FecR family protein n=1 Tax=Hirschia litorea TaxID=1199156 RepID=A0ABW2IQ08_9PROT
MTDPRNIIDFPDIQKVEAEAAEWIMKFEDGDETAADRAAFRKWLARGEQYKEAYQRLASLWGALDLLEDLEDLSQAEVQKDLRAQNTTTNIISRRSGLWAMAASIVGIAVVMGVGWQFHTDSRFDFEATYVTQLGKRQTVALPDGSEVILNTQSHVDVKYNDKERLIYLRKGEAFFEVAKNAEKPFSVIANGGAVKAVGTAFTVRLRDSKIDVTVAEGRVALYAASKEEPLENASYHLDKNAETLLQVTAGQQVLFRDKIEHLGHVDPSVMKRKLSWREGVLAFSGDPLSEMVEEVSRYTDIKIEIRDDALRTLPVAGYFEAGEVDAMLEALKLMANIEAEHIDSKHILLKRENLKTDD